MKLNKKGFTLIELLAVVIVLGLVLIIVFPSSIDVFKKAKVKSEETFLDRLSQSIDSYVSLNTDTITFSSLTGNYAKEENNSSYSVTVKEGTIRIETVINDGIITGSDYINPSNKANCNTNAQIKVYKDSDFVYCYKIKASELNCLTEEYINKLKEEQRNNNPYAIDTCIWTTSSEGE